ncbi:MAG TPA: DUF4126 domain-containing protein [Thermoanaerobaculia bacterium]|nr:DUF4126 domain-containing protein [Thermoanaerobaculia bacterium]
MPSPLSGIALVGLLAGTSLASGLRLYATVAVLGFLGRVGALSLPGELSALSNPWVIGVAASLYLVEFFADKVPYLDSVWDAVQTFVRVPASALLAWAALTHLSEPWRAVAALVCGGVTLSAHGLKSSARVAINTSPEPVTNWAASLAEDGTVAVLLWLAVAHPVAALAAAVAAVLLAVALLAWLRRALRRLVSGRPVHAA